MIPKEKWSPRPQQNAPQASPAAPDSHRPASASDTVVVRKSAKPDGPGLKDDDALIQDLQKLIQKNFFKDPK